MLPASSRSAATIYATALAGVSLLASGSSRAAFFTFDPDGAAPGNAPALYGAMDWSVGNSVGDNSIPATAGSTFQQYYHASLAGMVNTVGNPVNPAGLNSTFEITAVGSSTQVYTSVSPNVQFTHNLAPVQAANSFFEIWFDSTPDANPLAGTGYNDGVRILLAAPNSARPSAGAYDYAQGAAGGFVTEVFDQFGADNYPGAISAVGAGGMSYDGNVSSSDFAFFVDLPSEMSFNTSLVTPFRGTNPSGLFATAAGGAAPALVPSIIFNGVQTPDFQFQADANMTFVGGGVIPEPAGAALLVAAGGGTLFGAARRRRPGRR